MISLLFLAPLLLALLYVSSKVHSISVRVEDTGIYQQRLYHNMDERISSLREIMRTTEKALYKLMDIVSQLEASIRTNHIPKEQIALLQAEIGLCRELLAEYQKRDIEKIKKPK